MRIGPLFFVLALALNGCLDHSLDKLEFIQVLTESPVPIDLGTVSLQGRIAGLNRQNAEACGFLWSEKEKDIGDMVPGLADIAVTVPSGNDTFSAPFPMKQGQIIFFRAYARLGERLVYGEILPYSLDQIVVMSMDSATVENDRAALYGRLVGVSAQNKPVSAYGHVFSINNKTPEIGAPGCDTTNLGATTADLYFTSSLKNLPFNTTFYVRAYAIGANDIFYSQVTDTFRVRDGWRLAPSFQFFRDGVGQGIGGKGYVGFGCNSVASCFQAALSKTFWQYDPAGNAGAGSWNSLNSFPSNGDIRTNALTFSIPGLDTVYVIFGEKMEASGALSSVVDFWKYSIGSDAWLKGEDIPFINGATAPFRTGAIGFAVNGKAYVGAGGGYSGNQLTIYKNDFWEYNPAAGNWRQVAPLPMVISAFDSTVYQLGRFKATAFAVKNTAYAGGGETHGGKQLKDFWKFIPPNGLLDTSGRWELVGFFPGLSRVGAVSFSVGDKAFYGTGYNTYSGYLNDWWEFDPASNSWAAKTTFPGERRSAAFGFALQNHGYLGTGRGIKLKPNNQGFDPDIYNDFWLYTPEN